MDLYRRDYKTYSSVLPLLLPAPPLNQGPFPPPALPGYLGNTGLSAIPLALSFHRGPPVRPPFAAPPTGLPVLPQDSFRKHAVTKTPANSRSARFALFLRNGSLPC